MYYIGLDVPGSRFHRPQHFKVIYKIIILQSVPPDSQPNQQCELQRQAFVLIALGRALSAVGLLRDDTGSFEVTLAG